MLDRGAGQPATDRIRLSGLSATGHHGVLEHERRDGQTFVADVVLHVDTRPAAREDRLDLTVDYGALAQQVTAVLTGTPADLVETVAERIAAVALSQHTVRAVDVVVHKPQAPVTVPFADVAVEIHRDRENLPVVPAPGVLDDGGTDRLDVAPTEPVDVVLALGSNLGDSHDILRRTVVDLAELDGLEVTVVAPLARTGAVGGPEQADFLNTVVLGRTTLSPRALMHACQEIENRRGRVREERWGPRTVDIDLIVHGSTLAVADDLELPHPRAHERAFVLEPWAQVDPDAVLPGLGGGPVAALATTAPDRSGIRWMALDWWGVPEGEA